MRFINTFNCPEPYARAVTADSAYDRGAADYTVTELNSAPRQSVLLKRHDAELTEDVSDRLWVLGGTVAHEILARSGIEGRELFEKRLYAVVSGKKIGGKPDSLCLTSGMLSDYKWTSAWTYVFGRTEWVTQLNMYGFLARENGFKVENLEIFGMFRDWSESKAMQSKDYPPRSVARIPIEMWPHEKTRAYITERVKLHEAAKMALDENLAPCTPEERWVKPTTWAVMKPGRKSALSVHQTMENAEASLIAGASIVERPGASRRCATYCAVSSKCSQWKSDPTNKPEPADA
jgi:hypothetical protein